MPKRDRHAYDERQFVNVPLDQLNLGPNIRTDPGDIATLVESIREIGILEPIICCPTEDGKGVEVLCGQRRAAAAREAGLTVVPCVVRARPTDVERVFLQLVENAERKDMSPVEHGDTFRTLMENGYTTNGIATALGRSVSWVQDRSMVAGLPGFYRDAVHAGTMTMNFALDIPRSLSRDAAFTKRLAAIAHLGEQRMRDFVQAQVNRSLDAERSDQRRGHRQLTQQFTCRLTYETLQVAKSEARRRHVSVALWVEQAILAHARKGITK